MAEAVALTTSPTITIKKVDIERPWQWLAAGWRDFQQNPAVGLCYGVLATITGYLITLGLWQWGSVVYVLPLTAGFLIVGPILTVGLYEVSRMAQEGKTATIFDAVAAFKRNKSQIALMGVALMLMMFFWSRFAALLFFAYWGGSPPALGNLFAETFLRLEALPFLVIGVASGAILAFISYAISVVAIPMLLDRPECNVIDAIIKSVESVQLNFATMLLWAGIIVAITMAGLVTLYLGLIVTLPLVAHASWHAYRDLVEIAP